MAALKRGVPVEFAGVVLPPIGADEVLVEKVWGYERWLTNQDRYCAKLLLVQPGFYVSLHRHMVKDETFVVWAGLLCVEFWASAGEKVSQSQSFRMNPGDVVRVPTETWHRFWTPAGAAVLEVSTHHEDCDSERWPGMESGPMEGRILHHG